VRGEHADRQAEEKSKPDSRGPRLHLSLRDPADGVHESDHRSNKSRDENHADQNDGAAVVFPFRLSEEKREAEVHGLGTESEPKRGRDCQDYEILKPAQGRSPSMQQRSQWTFAVTRCYRIRTSEAIAT
jgi:hypothetical protein